MNFRPLFRLSFIAAAVAVSGCVGGSPTAVPATNAPATNAPATSAPAASAAATGATVEAKLVGTIGTVLVAGSNGMTVYQFAKDVNDSGTSACTDDCLSTWPAVTVPASGTPTGGTGVTGKLAAITRADDGAIQVTYNGLPIYFFSGDAAPGDAKGVYTNWAAVTP